MILQLGILSLAIFIKDIAVVFEFSGAFGCSSITYLFPSVAYILALNKYGTSRMRQSWDIRFYHFLSWAFLIIYVAVLSSFFYLEIMKGLGKLPSDKELEEANALKD